MNILRLTPHFYWPPQYVEKWDVGLDPIGGMQTQIYRMALSLSKKNVYQKILTIGMRGGVKKLRLNRNIMLISSNIPIIPIKSKVRGTVGLNFYWGMGVILKVIKIRFNSKDESYDMIHSHCSGVAAPLITGLITKWILKKPLVYTIHCCRLGTYEPMNQLDRILNKTIIRLEAYCLKKSDSILVLTKRTKELLLNNYNELNSKKIAVLPDIVSFHDFSKMADSQSKDFIYNNYQIPRNTKIISFVGRIAHEKGWQYFLKAVTMTRNNHYHIVFAGDGNEREELESMIIKLNLKCKVTITGFIPNELVASVINISEFLVIPSIHEELGSVLLEAAALKKTVIASSVGGLPHNITDGFSGLLVPSKSPQAIAEKIDFLLTHPEIKTEMGQNLYNSLIERYDSPLVINKLLNIYKRLIR